MSAGDLVTLEYIGTRPCHTPACGYRLPGVPSGENGPADMVRIGRFVLLTRQRCAGHWALSAREIAGRER